MPETNAAPRVAGRGVWTEAAAPPAAVDVTFEHGVSGQVRVRGHELAVDEPVDAGGEDSAPTPEELFVASLAACVGFCADRYLARHDMPREGLRVSAGFGMVERPARVGRVRIRLTVPGYLTETRRKALEAVVRHCTLHNTLVQRPDVAIDVE